MYLVHPDDICGLADIVAMNSCLKTFRDLIRVEEQNNISLKFHASFRIHLLMKEYHALCFFVVYI